MPFTPAIPSSSRAPYSLAAPSFTAPSQALAIVWKFALPHSSIIGASILAFALIAAGSPVFSFKLSEIPKMESSLKPERVLSCGRDRRERGRRSSVTPFLNWVTNGIRFLLTAKKHSNLGDAKKNKIISTPKTDRSYEKKGEDRISSGSRSLAFFLRNSTERGRSTLLYYKFTSFLRIGCPEYQPSLPDPRFYGPNHSLRSLNSHLDYTLLGFVTQTLILSNLFRFSSVQLPPPLPLSLLVPDPVGSTFLQTPTLTQLNRAMKRGERDS
ncbi:hypothetical protein VNO77_50429 [Canavalia gladiata]|uniref:Uncharacterized protein n=1 Tax=Canavalia gladiata TaxID=3824 RepID=A0AAN9JDP7_CANGL